MSVTGDQCRHSWLFNVYLPNKLFSILAVLRLLFIDTTCKPGKTLPQLEVKVVLLSSPLQEDDETITLTKLI